jgi:hypothetical protein
MPRGTKKPKILFHKFWNMENLTDEKAVEFTAQIHGCGKARAREIWERVKNISRGNPDDPHVRYYSETGKWRGKYTQTDRVSSGIVEREGTYRTKYQHVTYRLKEDLFAYIMEVEGCDEPEAERIFEVCKRNRKPIFEHHKKTDTWGGRLAPEPKVDAVPHYKLTPNQIELRQRYGDMPKLRHSHDLEKSEVVKWIADLDKCSLEEANKTFTRLKGCTKIDAIKPVLYDTDTFEWMGYRTAEKWNQAKGSDRPEEGAENRKSRPNKDTERSGETIIFRRMPRMHDESDEFEVWLRENISEDHEKAMFRFVDAEEHGHVVRLSANSGNGCEFVGADVVPEQEESDTSRSANDEEGSDADDEEGEDEHDEPEEYADPETIERERVEAARRSQEQEERMAQFKRKWDEDLAAKEKAAKEANLVFWYGTLTDSDSNVSQTIRSMPNLPVQSACQWIIRNLKSMWAEIDDMETAILILARARELGYIIPSDGVECERGADWKPDEQAA